MKKLQVAYTIKTTSLEFRSMNIAGLKITYSFDSDIYTNHFNKQIVRSNILTIYQHSSENTDEDFENLIGKLTRYCKELTPTKETKIMVARRLSNKAEEQVAKARSEKLEAALKKKGPIQGKDKKSKKEKKK